MCGTAPTALVGACGGPAVPEDRVGASSTTRRVLTPRPTGGGSRAHPARAPTWTAASSAAAPARGAKQTGASRPGPRLGGGEDRAFGGRRRARESQALGVAGCDVPVQVQSRKGKAARTDQSVRASGCRGGGGGGRRAEGGPWCWGVSSLRLERAEQRPHRAGVSARVSLSCCSHVSCDHLSGLARCPVFP